MPAFKRTIGAVAWAATAVIGAGCSGGSGTAAAPAPAPESASESASVPASVPASEPAKAAPDSHAADEQAIRDVVTRTMDAAARLDMDTYLRFYAPNAALVLPGLPIQYGISAPKQNGFPQGYKIKMDTAKVEVARAGDIGYAFGTYEQTAPDPKTKRLTDTVGKWMVVFQKQPDGSWGAIADTYNVDPPK
jgi:uncharacterized protein (TIGR02246 family)